MNLAKVRIPWPNREDGASRRRLAPVVASALLSLGLAAVASGAVIYWRATSTDWQPDASAASVTGQSSNEARPRDPALGAADGDQGQALSRLSLSPEIPGASSNAQGDQTPDEAADGLKTAPPRVESPSSTETLVAEAAQEDRATSTDPQPAGQSPLPVTPPHPPAAITEAPKPPVEDSRLASPPADPPAAISQTADPVEDTRLALLTADRNAESQLPAIGWVGAVYPDTGLEPDQGAEPGLELAALATPGSIGVPPVQSAAPAVATLAVPQEASPPSDSVGASSLGPADGRVLAVQVASMRTRNAAEREWTRLQKKFPDLLAEREMSVEEVDLGDSGTFFRVRTRSFDSVYAAIRLCDGLKRREQDCFVAQR